MKSPTTDQSKIQVTTQLFLSGALAKEKFENYLSQEFGDVFIYPWQLYLAQENNELETQYTSKNFDPDIGLYYYNARWYDPELGRFTTEDPARDGNNWYLYVGNNPLRYLDPTGLEITEHYPYYNMSSASRDLNLGNSDTDLFYYEGCYVTSYANVKTSMEVGRNHSPSQTVETTSHYDLNSYSTLFREGSG